MEVTFNQTRTDIANGSIQMLSEISMVEEEFISHESNTLKALNLLSNQSERKSIEKQSNLSRHKMETIPEGRYEDSRDVRNPLSRLLEKKGISRQE